MRQALAFSVLFITSIFAVSLASPLWISKQSGKIVPIIDHLGTYRQQVVVTNAPEEVTISSDAAKIGKEIEIQQHSDLAFPELSNASGIIECIIQFITDLWNGLVDVFQRTFGEVCDYLAKIALPIREKIIIGYDQARQFITENPIISTILGSITVVIPAYFGGPILAGIGNVVGAIATKIGPSVAKLFQAPGQVLAVSFKGILRLIGFGVSGPIKGSLATMWQSLYWGARVTAGSLFSILQRFAMIRR
ncbi:hypothetical protein BDZ91DRAFT_725985 [Kalaharituber pfeilii]|nr:hypothetical protein BDZ91DRAFT_725985 [Kalaharituber pfeilii]